MNHPIFSTDYPIPERAHQMVSAASASTGHSHQSMIIIAPQPTRSSSVLTGYILDVNPVTIDRTSAGRSDWLRHPCALSHATATMTDLKRCHVGGGHASRPQRWLLTSDNNPECLGTCTWRFPQTPFMHNSTTHLKPMTVLSSSECPSLEGTQITASVS